MNMKRNGWIKLDRSELEELLGLTDQEFRYYISSRLVCVWDRRNKLAGTFDARTHIVKQEFLPKWANGKINTVKNSLLKKGYYLKTDDARRLKIHGSSTHGSVGAESSRHIIENDVHGRELNAQERETRMAEIKKNVFKLASDKRINS